MKIKLIFPSPSEQYSVPWSTEKINHPLQSGISILAKNLEEKVSNVNVQCVGNQVVVGDNKKNYDFRYRTIEEFVDLCEDSSVVGMTVLLNNLSQSIKIAEELKYRNPDQTIVFGGPGVSDFSSAKLIMEKINAVDYVIKGDGEQALIDIIEGLNPSEISNSFYREGDEIKKSEKLFKSNLNERPKWDYKSFSDYEDIIRAFDSRTDLFQELREEYGNFIGMVGIQLSKGCEKAETSGRCFYCVSAQDPKVVMRDADNFWEQVLHLNKEHGITEYFIVDNVLATPKKLDALIESREKYSIPDNVQFRAYGYVPFFFEEEGDSIMEKLENVGIKNLFLGVENFDKSVNELSNKPGFLYESVEKIVDQATQYGIDMFLPIMVGMPGDSKQSLDYNIECMEKLLGKYGNKDYGQGGLVRVDLSMAMPLRGTPWYNQLVKKQEVLDFYLQETGTSLLESVDPNYDVLREASLKFHHSTGLTKIDLDLYRKEFTEMCCKYIRPDQVGGFEPTVLKED